MVSLEGFLLFGQKEKEWQTKDVTEHKACWNNLNILNYICYLKQYCSIVISSLLTCVNGNVGHYIPQLAVALLDYNSRSVGFKFNLKGVAVRFCSSSVISSCLYTSFILLLKFCSFFLIRLGIHFSDLIGIVQQRLNSFGHME